MAKKLSGGDFVVASAVNEVSGEPEIVGQVFGMVIREMTSVELSAWHTTRGVAMPTNVPGYFILQPNGLNGAASRDNNITNVSSAFILASINSNAVSDDLGTLLVTEVPNPFLP